MQVQAWACCNVVIENNTLCALFALTQKEAKLGEENKFFYDKERGIWREEGAEIPAAAGALPPPPTAGRPSTPAAATPAGALALSSILTICQGSYLLLLLISVCTAVGASSVLCPEQGCERSFERPVLLWVHGAGAGGSGPPSGSGPAPNQDGAFPAPRRSGAAARYVNTMATPASRCTTLRPF
jgi:hypothetical protein